MVRIEIDLAALQYPTVVRPEPSTDGGLVYVAEIPDLVGCMSHGATPEEALQNLEDAKREYLAALAERDLPIPVPNQAPPVRVVVWSVIVPADEVDVQERQVMPAASFSPSDSILTSA